MLVMFSAIGIILPAVLLALLALQRKWHAFAVFALVLVSIYALFAIFAALPDDVDPANTEPPPEGLDRLLVAWAWLATPFANLAALLAISALFMRWSRDRR